MSSLTTEPPMRAFPPEAGSQRAATPSRESAAGPSGLLNILIHDYAGHPFQVQLSRELASRGHRVTHAYFAADAGPKGTMKSDDPLLAFEPVGLGIDYSKQDFRKRRAGDIAYGAAVGQLIERLRPDVVISGNTPTEAQERLVAACRRVDTPFVYWCQDFYSIAASRLLAKKLPGLGHLVGAYYRFLERRQMRRAAHVVHITEAFCDQTDRWGIPRAKVSVIPNWGAIDEIPVLPRDTAWARAQGLHDGPRLIYSGTLALKHNPELLAGLAKAVEGQAQVVLVSNGVGADTLAARAAELPALTCLPLQPFDVFPEVLASADVLLAVIEREAGEFSVPSKILSYLCAGRPIVLAAPKDNLAARIIRDTGAGMVVEPEDVAGFVAAARDLILNEGLRTEAGAAARRYAEANFLIQKVANRFISIVTAQGGG